MLNVRTALSQVPADFNGDGGVDGADLPLFAACMGGPNSSPSAACAAPFYIEIVNWVGLAQAMKMQAAAARKAGCVLWDSTAATRRFPLPSGVARGYVNIGAIYPTPSLHGAAALIDGNHRPVLCGLPAGTATAFSLRWASVAGVANATSPDPYWWLQSGPATYRRWGNPLPPPSTLVTTHPYAEAVGVNGTWTLHIDLTFTPTASNVYMVHWSRNIITPSGQYFRDGLRWDQISTNISTQPGYFVQFSGETRNTADRMSGTQSSPCKILDCRWEAGAAGNWIPVEFFPADLFIAPWYLYGGRLVGADGLEFWDYWP